MYLIKDYDCAERIRLCGTYSLDNIGHATRAGNNVEHVAAARGNGHRFFNVSNGSSQG